jgi:hypothetical protein
LYVVQSLGVAGSEACCDRQPQVTQPDKPLQPTSAGRSYFTDSTLPGMVLHAGGNIFSAFDLFTRGRSEWQLSTEATPLIWETGLDVAFWGSVTALLIVGALTLGAYSTLARATRRARASSVA